MAPSAVTREAWRHATDARGQLRLGAGAPVPDLVRLLEGSVRSVPVCILPLPDGVAGAYARQFGRSFLFVNRNQAPVRQRFTLAHEYGHHWMEHPAVIDSPNDISGKTRDPREIQANAFAAELLVPREALREWVDARFPDREVDLEVIVSAAAFFTVSAQVIRYRLEDAQGLIKPSAIRNLDQQISSGEHRTLSRRLGLAPASDTISQVSDGQSVHMPAAMEALAFSGYQKGLVPEERLAHSLRLEPEAVRRIIEERDLQPASDDEPDW